MGYRVLGAETTEFRSNHCPKSTHLLKAHRTLGVSEHEVFVA